MADPNTDPQHSPQGEEPDRHEQEDGTGNDGPQPTDSPTPFGDDPQELQGDDGGSGGS
jgi:hypothetical protein